MAHDMARNTRKSLKSGAYPSVDDTLVGQIGTSILMENDRGDTKSFLVTRDLDLLGPLSDRNLIRVVISVTSLDQSLIRVMEPRTSAPAARLAAIRRLSERGVPVAVNVAPVSNRHTSVRRV